MLTNQYQAILKNVERIADVGYWSYSPVTGDIFWSDYVYKIHGLRVEDGVPSLEGAIDFYHPDDRAIVTEKVERALEYGEDFRIELRLVRPDGEVRYVSSVGEPHYDEHGRVESIFGVFIDRTDMVNMDTEVKRTKQFLNLIFDNIPDALFVKDENFKIVEANHAFLNLYPEKQRSHVLGHTTLEDYLPEEREAFLEQDKVAFKKGESRVMETIHTPAGFTQNFDTRKVRFQGADNKPYILGLARDISDLIDIQERLKKSEERYEVAVKGAAVGLWDWNIEKGELYWSDKFKELMQINSDGFIPTFEDFVARLHEDDRDAVVEAVSAHLEERKPFDVEYRLRCDDGEYIWVHAKGQAVWDHEGVPVRMAGSVDDITEKKKIWDALVSSNEELERFAYVAAHDLQEPLRTIMSFSQILSSDYAERLDAEGQEYLGYCIKNAKRMQMLIQDLLTYSRVHQTVESVENIDLNQVVGSIVDDYAGKDVTFHVDELPHVKMSGLHAHQLFHNLVSNAIKFGDDKKGKYVSISSLNGEEHHHIVVSDNGIGIAPEYFEQIFAPFKRLHSYTKISGTGIGLSICKKVVESVGGKIWVTSQVGEGAHIHITLPKVKEEGGG